MHHKYVPYLNEEGPARAMNAMWLLRPQGCGSQRDVLHSLSGGIRKYIRSLACFTFLSFSFKIDVLNCKSTDRILRAYMLDF